MLQKDETFVNNVSEKGERYVSRRPRINCDEIIAKRVKLDLPSPITSPIACSRNINRNEKYDEIESDIYESEEYSECEEDSQNTYYDESKEYDNIEEFEESEELYQINDSGGCRESYNLKENEHSKLIENKGERSNAIDGNTEDGEQIESECRYEESGCDGDSENSCNLVNGCCGDVSCDGRVLGNCDIGSDCADGSGIDGESCGKDDGDTETYSDSTSDDNADDRNTLNSPYMANYIRYLASKHSDDLVRSRTEYQERLRMLQTVERLAIREVTREYWQLDGPQDSRTPGGESILERRIYRRIENFISGGDKENFDPDEQTQRFRRDY